LIPFDVLIQIEDTQSDVKLDKNWVSSVVSAVLTKEREDVAEVYIHFVDTSTICALHQQYFEDPSVTDCISFPLDAKGIPYRVLGEVFVCPKTGFDFVSQKGGDLYREITHYLIHGLLHLIGHEDLSPKGRAKMRRKERSHLKRLEELGLLPFSDPKILLPIADIV